MSKWHVHIRVEKNGQYAEYDDSVDVASLDGREPTDRDLEQQIMDMLITHSPHMKGGRVTRRNIRRLR